MNPQKTFLAHIGIWAAYEGFTAVYLTAYALALGASNTVIGFLGALPFLASMLTQIIGAELVQHYSRRHIYALFAGIGRLLWLPILLAPFLFEKPLLTVAVAYLFIKLFETMTDPSSTTLLADIVPEQARGEFTSNRLRLLSLCAMISMVLGGLWLKQFPKESPTGFAIMFAVGAVFGIISVIFFTKVKEPEYSDHVHHKLTEFFSLDSNLRRFVTFSCAFNFAYMLASPLIAVYMLKTLELTYSFYGLLTALSLLTQLIFSRYIGKLTDSFGDKPIAILGIIGTAVVPLIYLLINKETTWLLIPAHIFSGFVWTAADISRFNLLLDLTSPQKRAMQIAEYSLYTNIPLIVAPILGGWMTENVNFIIAGIPLVFTLSAILRFISAAFLIPIKEPRAKQEYSAAYVLRHSIHFSPTKGIVQGVSSVRRVAGGLFR
ncbi:MFS transporter [Candidatus Woesearchaeota archaeon]|nr:MFS transporter [Candidatus Woesearchaeota archaeon]